MLENKLVALSEKKERNNIDRCDVHQYNVILKK